jgi:D-cysteine desulfhydrase family pyridoxal phosphate-dependent enzyme
VRKLEFLLAEALVQKCTSVVTVGGIQSNHCRATAAAAARVGLASHLILRTKNDQEDPGLVGNLLVSRMVGAHLHLVTNEKYDNHAEGGWGLVKDLRNKLSSSDPAEKPYAFPSGGSSGIGVWGYIEAVRELLVQLETRTEECGGEPFDRIYFSCGSGGTAAGLALGLHMSGTSLSSGGTTELVGIAVDDDPEFFYNKIDALLESMGMKVGGRMQAKCLLRIVDGVGSGYAVSTNEELSNYVDIARCSGVVLDPVYSGKAAIGMLRDLDSSVESVERRQSMRVLFLHTGGLLGMFDKLDQLITTLKIRS